MSDRSQRIMLQGLESKAKALRSGVPQGWILGPTVFKCLQYCSTHVYVDDLKVYSLFSPSQLLTVNDKINQDLDRLLRVSSREF